jgi:hypothetical protein
LLLFVVLIFAVALAFTYACNTLNPLISCPKVVAVWVAAALAFFQLKRLGFNFYPEKYNSRCEDAEKASQGGKGK